MGERGGRQDSDYSAASVRTALILVASSDSSRLASNNTSAILGDNTTRRSATVPDATIIPPGNYLNTQQSAGESLS